MIYWLSEKYRNLKHLDYEAKSVEKILTAHRYFCNFANRYFFIDISSHSLICSNKKIYNVWKCYPNTHKKM